MKKIINIILIFVIFFTCGCNNVNIKIKGEEEKIENSVKTEERISKTSEVYLDIMTTNKFVYYMVKDIVKGKHYVDYMLKSEEDQWKYTYTSDSIDNISKKDMFIYTGACYEPWVDNFVDEIRKGKVTIINSSRGTTLFDLTKGRKYSDTVLNENPYYWLDIDNYKIQLANIKNALQERDPENREFYEKNFSNSMDKINTLAKEFSVLEKSLKDYVFISTNDRFDYYLKYLGVDTLKLDEQGNLLMEEQKVINKLNKAKNKKLVFIYESKNVINNFNPLINKYKMSIVSGIVYKFNMTYKEILNYNLKELKKLVEKI